MVTQVYVQHDLLHIMQQGDTMKSILDIIKLIDSARENPEDIKD